MAERGNPEYDYLYEPRLGGGVATPTAAPTPPGANSEYDYLYADVKGTGTPTDPLQGQISNLEAYGKMAGLGVKDLQIGFGNLPALFDPTYYDKLKKVEQLTPQQLQDMEDVQQWKAKHDGDVAAWLAPAAESAAFSTGAMGAGLVGGVLGGAAGAALAGPGGAIAGARVGQLGGAVAGGMAFSVPAMTGMAYGEFRDEGVGHNRAVLASVAVGLINGGIESVENLITLGTGKAAAESIIKGAGFKAAVKEFVKGYLLNIPGEMAEEAAQELVQGAAERALGLSDAEWTELKGKGRNGTKRTMLDRVIQSGVSGGQAAAVLGLVMPGAGMAAGQAVRATQTVKATLAPPSAPTSLKAVGRAITDAAFTSPMKEKVAEAVQQAQQPKMLTGGVSMSVDEAEAKREAAEKKLKQIRADIAYMEELTDGDVSEELLTAKTEAIAELKQAQDEKREAEFKQTKADIEEKLTQPGDDETTARLKENLADVDKKYRVLKASQALADLKLLVKAADKEVSELQLEREQLLGASKVKGQTQGTYTTIANQLDANQKKLDKALIRQTDLQLVHDLIDENLLSPEEIDKLRTKIPSFRTDALLKYVKKKIIKTARETDVSVRRNVKENQRLLEKLARMSGLSAADQQKLPSVTGVQTNEQLNKVMDAWLTKIADLQEHAALREAWGNLHDALGKILPTDRQSRFARGTDYQDVLDEFRYYMALDAGKKTDRVAESQKRVAEAYAAYVSMQPGDPQEEQKQLDFNVSMLVGDIYNKNSEEVQALTDVIVSGVKSGEAARLDQLLQEKAKRDEARMRAAEVLPGKEHDYTKTKWERFKDAATGSYASLVTFSGKLHVLASRLGNVKAIEDWKRYFDVGETTQKVREAKTAAMERLLGSLEKATGHKMVKVLKTIAKGAATTVEIDFVHYADREQSDPDLVTHKYTLNQMIQFLAHMPDPTAQKGLREGNGFTTVSDAGELSTEQVMLDTVTEHLGEDGVKLLRGLQQFYQGEFADLAAHYKDETGLNLAPNTLFGGTITREGATENANYEGLLAQLYEGGTFTPMAAGRPGTTIARVQSGKAIKPVDAFMNAIYHINQVEHWKGWRKRSKLLAAAFSDATNLKQIEHHYGSAFKTALVDNLKAITQGDARRNSDVPYFIQQGNKIARAVATMYLMWKPMQFVKQITALYGFSLYVPQGSLAAGISDFMRDPKANWERINATPYFKTRYGNAQSTFMGVLRAPDLSEYSRQLYTELGLSPLIAGDRLSVTLGMYAVEKYHLDRDATAEEAWAKAVEAAETTQASSSVAQMSDLARNENLQSIMVFTQQPLRMVQIEAEAMMSYLRASKGNKTTAGIQLAKTIWGVHATQALFATIDLLWWSLVVSDKDDDDKNKLLWKWLIEGAVGPAMAVRNIPVVGDIAINATNHIENVIAEANGLSATKPYGAETPLVSSVQSAFDFWGDVDKLLSGDYDAETPDMVAKTIYDFSRSMLNARLPLPFANQASTLNHIRKGMEQ